MRDKLHEPRAVIADFAEGLFKAIQETRLTLFVCGPNPRGNSHSAALRRYVSAELQKSIKGVTVVWGEHRDLRGVVGDVRLRRFNDATKELQFASTDSDLVVIFPDSPGSFVELGMFSMHPHVCPQLAIIFDKRYKRAKSFAVAATGKAARSKNATIKFVPYRNKRLVLRYIERLVRAKQESKYMSRTYAAR